MNVLIGSFFKKKSYIENDLNNNKDVKNTCFVLKKSK